jgi:hypothetical protein
MVHLATIAAVAAVATGASAFSPMGLPATYRRSQIVGSPRGLPAPRSLVARQAFWDKEEKGVVTPEGECEPVEAGPMDKIKELGIAGTVSFILWEWAFWIIGGGGAALVYKNATGHWPDFNNKEDLAETAGSAFAFINVARLAVPVRIGLAVSTAPWVDENIVKKFQKKDDECELP